MQFPCYCSAHLTCTQIYEIGTTTLAENMRQPLVSASLLPLFWFFEGWEVSFWWILFFGRFVNSIPKFEAHLVQRSADFSYFLQNCTMKYWKESISLQSQPMNGMRCYRTTMINCYKPSPTFLSTVKKKISDFWITNSSKRQNYPHHNINLYRSSSDTLRCTMEPARNSYFAFKFPCRIHFLFTIFAYRSGESTTEIE